MNKFLSLCCAFMSFLNLAFIIIRIALGAGSWALLLNGIAFVFCAYIATEVWRNWGY